MDRPLENKRNNYKKPGIAVAILLLLFSVFHFAFTDFDAKRISKDKIRIGQVKRGELKVVVLGNGTIVPRDIEWVVPKVSGAVVDVKARAGDWVKEEQELVRLVNEEVVAALAEKASRLAESKAILAAKEFDLHAQEMDYEADLLRAESEYKHTAALYEMQRKLVDEISSPISRLEYQQTKIKVEQLERLNEVSKNRLANFKSLKDAQLVEYKTKVAAASEEKIRLEKKVAELKVTAKKAGVIQDFDLKVGQRVEVGDNLGKIINPSEVFVRLKVPALQSFKLQPKQTAIIEINNREVTGRVERIDPNVKGTTIEVDVALDEPFEEARVGMFVNGRILVQQLDETLFVEKPANSVESGVSKLFKLDDNGDYANLIPVSTGVFSSNHVQIIDGLKEGDRIILSDLSDTDGAEKLYLD